jgi:pyruvate ferredoxin oxidoreductase beta subunit
MSEVIAPGHTACAGCGEILGERVILEAIGKDVVVCQATGCMEITTTAYPTTSWKVPWVHVTFENASAVASGVAEALAKQGKKTTVVAIGGDGGMMDIGLQALSGALERGHNVLHVITDNEAYMNTGIQRSSGTPKYAATTTSPAGKVLPGKLEWKKDIVMLCAAHHIPYVATASVGYLDDLKAKVRKALTYEGPKVLHVLTPCVPGWGIDTDKAISLAKSAVETGVWPLYEVEKGRIKVNYKPEKLKPIEDYLKPQKRFKHLTPEQMKELAAKAKADYERLVALEGCSAQLF